MGVRKKMYIIGRTEVAGVSECSGSLILKKSIYTMTIHHANNIFFERNLAFDSLTSDSKAIL